jgi:hypothetical protein
MVKVTSAVELKAIIDELAEAGSLDHAGIVIGDDGIHVVDVWLFLRDGAVWNEDGFLVRAE